MMAKAKAWFLVGALLLETGNAIDVKLKRIKCNRKLPVSVVETTFNVTCNRGQRCSFNGRDTALIKGQFIFNGATNAGISGTRAYVEVRMQTMTGDFVLVDEVRVDLCSTDGSTDDDAAVTYNDDDAAAVAYSDDGANNDYYNANAYGNANDDNDDNDGNVCPYDGVYPFSTSFAIPKHPNMWMATGWSASGQINMYTFRGNVIGTCHLKFSTFTTHPTPSSKRVFAYFVTVGSVAVFLCVFLGIRRGSGFSKKDDARMFLRLEDDVMQSATSIMNRKNILEHDDLDTTYDSGATGDTSFDTHATGCLDTTNDTSATPGCNGTGTRISSAQFA